MMPNSCFYTKDEELIAVDAINNPKEFLISRKLVANKVKIKPKRNFRSKYKLKRFNLMKKTIETEYALGQVVKHKYLDFRGVIYDVDPEFNNTEEWYQSIPLAIRPKKDQPFYHVFAENDQVFYSAYVSQQNLLVDDSRIPLEHPDVPIFFRL